MIRKQSEGYPANYYINQFKTDADIVLPCESNGLTSDYDNSCMPLSIRGRNFRNDEFSYCHLIGVSPTRLTRVYDTDKGIYVNAFDNCSLLVSRNEQNIYYDISSSGDIGTALVITFLVNLGPAIKNLIQGNLPIHCASVIIGNKLIGICADSGTGKSTLLWALLNSGAVLAADDVLTLRIIGRHLLATPSRSIPSKISRSTAENLQISLDGYAECIPGTDEYWIPVPHGRRLMNDRSLDALIILAPDALVAQRTHPNIIPIKHEDSAAALIIKHTQGLWATAAALDPQSYMRICREVAKKTRFFVLQYERTFEALPMLVESLEKVAQDI